MTPTILQNLVFPPDPTNAALPLYLEPGYRHAVASDSAAVVKAGETVSFASYFNAFPAGYWRNSTSIDRVALTLRLRGSGRLVVMLSGSDGVARVHSSREFGDPTAVAHPAAHEVGAELTVDVPLAGFDDGGWIWFDVAARSDVRVDGATWGTEQSPEQPGRLCIGITTYDKPDYVVRSLRKLAASEELLTELVRIFVIDQGGKHPEDDPDYPDVASSLGDLLRIIRQPNLGGSGGFSRAMAESLDVPEAAFVMLLDDDVELQPESIRRALQFARYCVRPTLVGGHMLDLGQPAVLHTFSEVIEPETFMWGPPDRAHERTDFATVTLRETAWLHRREDSEFNGWWMCLIPTSVIRQIGLSLPFFIKWDDAEYGLRAGAAGTRTVSLPGAALWHMSWLDKDDTVDWQAYFHARNRLITALLHSRRPLGGSVIAESRRLDLKQLLSMQYYPVSIRHQAIRDVLAGPGDLGSGLSSKRSELSAAAHAFSEMVAYRAERRPGAAGGRPPYPPTDGRGPRGRALAIFTLRAAARHLLVPPKRRFVAAPQLEIGKRDATWWRLPWLDSALVESADTRTFSWYTRDPATFRRALWDSLRLHRALRRRWNELRADYRSALPRLTSAEAWARQFGTGEPDAGTVCRQSDTSCRSASKS